MATMVELKASSREATGKAANRAIRKQGRVPAIVYGGGEDPQSVTVEYKEVFKQVQTGHFLSTVYMLDLEGKKVRVIPRDVQLHPVRDFPLHVDFMRISRTSRVEVEVAVQFINEADSPGLKRGGVLNIVRHEIELSCPAESIPENIEIDLTGLDIGDSDFTIATIVGSSAMKSEEEGEQAETSE
jgi:large subunit ribosomal protein L25